MAVQIGTSKIPSGRPPHELVTPPYGLTSSQYVERAIAISVFPIMEAGQITLTAADERSEAALELFKERMAECAPAGVPDARGWAAGKVGDLFRRVKNFDGDVWYGVLPSCDPLLVVKQASIDNARMSLEQAVRRAHLAVVAEAVEQGLPVPDAVLQEYRVSVDAVGAARELQ